MARNESHCRSNKKFSVSLLRLSLLHTHTLSLSRSRSLTLSVPLSLSVSHSVSCACAPFRSLACAVCPLWLPLSFVPSFFRLWVSLSLSSLSFGVRCIKFLALFAFHWLGRFRHSFVLVRRSARESNASNSDLVSLSVLDLRLKSHDFVTNHWRFVSLSFFFPLEILMLIAQYKNKLKKKKKREIRGFVLCFQLSRVTLCSFHSSFLLSFLYKVPSAPLAVIR